MTVCGGILHAQYDGSGLALNSGETTPVYLQGQGLVTTPFARVQDHVVIFINFGVIGILLHLLFIPCMRANVRRRQAALLRKKHMYLRAGGGNRVGVNRSVEIELVSTVTTIAVSRSRLSSASSGSSEVGIETVTPGLSKGETHVTIKHFDGATPLTFVAGPAVTVGRLVKEISRQMPKRRGVGMEDAGPAHARASLAVQFEPAPLGFSFDLDPASALFTVTQVVPDGQADRKGVSVGMVMAYVDSRRLPGDYTTTSLFPQDEETKRIRGGRPVSMVFEHSAAAARAAIAVSARKFEMVQSALTFDQHVALAESQGYELASIATVEDSVDAHTVAAGKGVFLGARKKAHGPGAFEWTDGTEWDHTQWLPGEPSWLSDGSDGVVMRSNGKWHGVQNLCGAPRMQALRHAQPCTSPKVFLQGNEDALPSAALVSAVAAGCHVGSGSARLQTTLQEVLQNPASKLTLFLLPA